MRSRIYGTSPLTVGQRSTFEPLPQIISFFICKTTKNGDIHFDAGMRSSWSLQGQPSQILLLQWSNLFGWSHKSVIIKVIIGRLKSACNRPLYYKETDMNWGLASNWSSGTPALLFLVKMDALKKPPIHSCWYTDLILHWLCQTVVCLQYFTFKKNLCPSFTMSMVNILRRDPKCQCRNIII